MDGECVQRKISDILTSSLAFKRSVVYLQRKIPNQILQPIQIPCLLTASKVVALITIHFHCSLLPTVFVFFSKTKICERHFWQSFSENHTQTESKRKSKYAIIAVSIVFTLIGHGFKSSSL